MQNVSKILTCKAGQGLTEYLVLLILVAVISMSAVRGLGNAIKDRLDKAKNKVESLHVIDD